MKRKLSFAPLCLALTLILSSCGSSLVVEKRQHNKGYHVAFNKNSRHAAQQKAEELAVEKTIRETEMIQEPVAAKLPVKSLEEINGVTVTPVANELVADKSGKQIQPVEKTQTRTKRTPLKQVVETPLRTIRETGSQMKEVKESIKADKQMNQADRDGGLSFFWIVILILLILWALGLIGSWGSFVNILLVVALILLILWLLRVL
jgi:hypothetical protein